MESLEGGAHHSCIEGADGSGGQEGRPDVQAGHCKDTPDERILRGVLRASLPGSLPSLAPSRTLVQDESRGVDHDAGVEHLRVEGAEQVRWRAELWAEPVADRSAHWV